ncbi:MAG: hypothetical protein KR126chlam1_00098 [Chlamydiae bacterium]|nr:hypothetical protein [Chlamydiota bacterium]
MQQIDKNILTLKGASKEFALSLRQTKRIRKRYLLEGANGLISKHVGKPGPNQVAPEEKLKY